jgi:hypothetical protein
VLRPEGTIIRRGILPSVMRRHYNLMRFFPVVAQRNAIYFQATTLSEAIRIMLSFDGKIGRLTGQALSSVMP